MEIKLEDNGVDLRKYRRRHRRRRNDMVGIVILNYNSWADTVACVDSIHEAEKKLEFRIYLVDNCSPVRPETGVLESLDKKGVIFIQNERNAGYSAGNNIGIKKGT